MSQPTGDGTQSVVIPDPQGGTGTDPNAGTTDPGTGTPPGEPGTAKTYTQAEMDAIMARMQAADRTAAQKTADLKKITDAQLSEQEKKEQDLKDAQEKASKLAVRVQEQAVENAFLTDRTYSWVNPGSALKLLDRDGVTVDDDGKVQGMKAALDKLAKSDSYLIKTPDGDDASGGKGKQGTTGSTGTNRQHGQGNDRAKWERDFPAMRGRV
jgi:hypothetical protein